MKLLNNVKQTNERTNNNDNDYLSLIISELNDVYPEKFSQTIHLISTRKNVFNKYKREITNNINFAKNNSNLMWFSFLVGCRFNDSDFVNLLISNFDFNNIYENENNANNANNTNLAKFAKGIYHLKKGQTPQAKDLLWEVYQNNIYYFEHRDFVDLHNLLVEFSCIDELKTLLEYLTKTYPQIIEYQRYYLDFLINNTKDENLAENNTIKQLINFILQNAKDSNDWQQLSMCFYNLGDIENFYKYFEKAVLNLVYHPNIFELSTKNKNDKFPAEVFLNKVNEVLQILQDAGEQPFPEGGTLLGLYRDGKLMDYDKDTDIGILVNNNDDVIRIINIISASKNFSCPAISQLNFNKEILNISVRNKQSGVFTDIFFFHKKGDFIYEGINTKTSNLYWKYSAFDLIKTKFNNTEYYIPNNIELYLTELFGKNWNEHISVWDSLINCPNITPESKLVVYYYGTMRMHEALRQHKYAKALNYYTTLKDRWQYPFTSEMSAKIESYLEKIKAKQQ